MTRDQAIKRATEMRERAGREIVKAANTKLRWGIRYEATIRAEDCEEAARGFDKFAEMKERSCR